MLWSVTSVYCVCAVLTSVCYDCAVLTSVYCACVVLTWVHCVYANLPSVYCLCCADISVPLRKRTLKHIFPLAGVNIYPAYIFLYKDNVWCPFSCLDSYHLDGYVLRFCHQWYCPRNFANCRVVNSTKYLRLEMSGGPPCE